MNEIPIFPLLAQSDEVRSLISNDDGTLRTFQFGLVDEAAEMPYVVYKTITGTSFNTISDRSSGDRVILQIDIYATDPIVVKDIEKAVRHAIELNCYVVSYRDVDRDPVDHSYHIGFDTSWILTR